jgi:aryl-alcohol dehydrogenase-like predicted oxidoreductase
MKNIPRQDYIVSSKIWLRRRRRQADAEMPEIEATIERFLKELKTDYIDILQIHCVVDPEWNKRFAKHMEILAKLKEKGIIRAHGVSVHSLEALKTAAEEPWVDIVHTRINAYGDKMDASCEEVVPVIKKIHAAGKGVIGMKLIGEGDFRDSDEKINRSLEYAMNLGCVDNLIVGFESEAEIDNYQQRMRNTSQKTA